MLQNLPQRLSAILRLGHDFQVRRIFQQPPQSLPYQGQLMRQNASNSRISLDLCVGAHSSSYSVGNLGVARSSCLMTAPNTDIRSPVLYRSLGALCGFSRPF
jgi:hypothetical protein